MFKNPLSQENFSDPFITYDKETGYYYFLASYQCHQVTIYRSRHVGDILTNGEEKIVYSCPESDVWGPFWAAEMYKIGKKWYIYTSCREENSDNWWATKQLLILQSKTEDPFDGFEFGSKPDRSIFAIDPSCAFINGKQYICYSRVQDGVGQLLEIREMSDPLTFTDKVAEITRPSLPWEFAEGYNIHSAINEGAYFIKKGKRLFIIYSANGCWSDDYCLGVLEHLGGEVCDSNNWIKHKKPLFVKGNGIYGVGHAAFFYSPDETELWCAYHCLLRSNPTREEMIRHTCIQKIDFDENDYPVMGQPVGINTSLKSPSGEIKS